jgi:hypothetical protein
LRIAGIASILALWPVAGWAIDLTPDPSWYLSDPAALTLKGRIESLSAFAYSETNETWENLSGVKSEHFLNANDQVTQTFFYGITDRLQIGAAANWSNSHDTYTYTASPTFESSKSGFGNPTFGATYRIVEQGRSPVSVDGTLQYSPAIGSDTGAAEYGKIAVSRKMKSLTIQEYVSAKYYEAYDTVDEFNESTRSDGSYWDYQLGTATQLRLSDHWAINSGFAINFNSNQSNADATSHFAYTDRHDSSVEPYVGIQYEIMPNRMIVGIEYEHDFIGDDHRSGTNNGMWTDQSRDFYAANLRLLFF